MKRLLTVIWHLLALTSLVWLLYAQTLGFAYVWDDIIIFLNKNDLMTEPLSWNLLAQPVLVGTTYFRPLVFLTWFAEFHVFGQEPKVSHAFNVIIFTANVLLVYGVAKCFFAHQGLSSPQNRALLAAAIYAVHPAAIETTAWVSGRFDLMCTTFVLAGLYVYLVDIPRRIQATLMALFMILATFCKELGVVFPAIWACVAWTLFRSQEPDQKWLATFRQFLRQEKTVVLALLTAMIIYLIVRQLSVAQTYHVHMAADDIWATVVEMMAPLEALREYVLIVLLPFDRIAIFYPPEEYGLGQLKRLPANLLTLVAIAVVIWHAVVKRRTVACLLLASLVGISLVLHVIPITIGPNLVQARFLTLSLAFFAMAVAAIQWKIPAWMKLHLQKNSFRRLGVMIAVGWFGIAIFVTYTTIPVWKTPLNLWAWAFNKNPEVPAVRFNYLQAAVAEGRLDLVENEFAKKIEDNSGLDVAEQILYAHVLSRKLDPEALNYIRGVMYALPDFRRLPGGKLRTLEFGLSPLQVAGVLLDYSTATMYFENDLNSALRYNEAAQWYMSAGEITPALLQRAGILYALGRIPEARQILEERRKVYYFNRERLLIGLGNFLKLYCNKWGDPHQAGDACTALMQYEIPKYLGRK